MVSIDRNIFVDGSWTLRKLENYTICATFDCDDDDLNEYFRVDAPLHKQELLTQTYYLHENTIPDVVVALLDFCNDAVRIEKCRKAIETKAIEIPSGKQYPNLPAVKLTRIGVVKEFQGMNIGSHALNMIKKFFTTDNRTGCRFITVDAYNTERVIRFYERNGFKPFSDKDKNKKNRSLFFDLKRFTTGNYRLDTPKK